MGGSTALVEAESGGRGRELGGELLLRSQDVRVGAGRGGPAIC